MLTSEASRPLDRHDWTADDVLQLMKTLDISNDTIDHYSEARWKLTTSRSRIRELPCKENHRAGVAYKHNRYCTTHCAQ